MKNKVFANAIKNGGAPKKDDSPAESPDVKSTEAEPQPSKVLLIEDNPGDADLIVEWSSIDTKRPLTIIRSSSLQDASQVLQVEAFDLILLDLGLPESVGVETYKKFSTGAGNIPIIVISGQDNLDVAKACIAQGAQDFLTKNHIGSFLNGVIYNTIARAKLRESAEIALQASTPVVVRPTPSHPTQIMPGCLLGHYTIVKHIETGGLGDVYLAHETILNRDVSIKVLRSKFCANEALRNSFCTEAQTIAGLRHPNIMPIHYIGYEGGRVYYVMPYIKEGSIKKWIDRKHAMGFEDVQWFLPQAIAALKAAMSHNIIHLDVKPENFLIDENKLILLCDFGFARSIHNAILEDKKSIFGTLDYIAPERIYGQPVDHRADIYSLGATVFYLLTGASLNKGHNCDEIKESFAKPFPADFLRNMSIPEDWIHFLEKMTKIKPEERFQNYTEVSEAFARLAPSTYTPPTQAESASRSDSLLDTPTRQIVFNPLDRAENSEESGR